MKGHTDPQEKRFECFDLYTSDALQKLNKPAVAVIFANATHPGGLEGGLAQEETTLRDCTSLKLPENYGEGLNLNPDYQGMMVMSDVAFNRNNTSFTADLVFSAAPNMYGQETTGPGPAFELAALNEKKLFINRDSKFDTDTYVKHLAYLIFEQFSVAKEKAKPLVAGQFGCGVFCNDPDVVAALYYAVGNLPQFQSVEVIFALGENASNPKEKQPRPMKEIDGLWEINRTSRTARQIFENPNEGIRDHVNEIVASMKLENKNIDDVKKDFTNHLVPLKQKISENEYKALADDIAYWKNFRTQAKELNKTDHRKNIQGQNYSNLDIHRVYEQNMLLYALANSRRQPPISTTPKHDYDFNAWWGLSNAERTGIRLQTVVQAQQTIKTYLSSSYNPDVLRDIPAANAHLGLNIEVNPSYSSLKEYSALAPAKAELARSVSKFQYQYASGILVDPSKKSETTKLVAMISARGINFMGSSLADTLEYSIEGNKAKYGSELLRDKLMKNIQDNQNGKFALNRQAYRHDMEEITDMLCAIAKENGKTTLVLPEFSVGIYINNLTQEDQKEAKKIMIQSFAKAANKYGINLEMLIFPRKDMDVKATIESYNSYLVESGGRITVKAGDIFDEMQKDDQKSNRVFLNPGSDRTIGGAREHYNPGTLEEKLAQQTTMLGVFSMINPVAKHQMNKSVENLKSERAKQNVTVSNAITPSTTEDIQLLDTLFKILINRLDVSVKSDSSKQGFFLGKDAKWNMMIKDQTQLIKSVPPNIKGDELKEINKINSVIALSNVMIKLKERMAEGKMDISTACAIIEKAVGDVIEKSMSKGSGSRVARNLKSFTSYMRNEFQEKASQSKGKNI